MVPSVPEAYLEARRNQIINAAFECFGEKGFHKATMQDVFKAANLSSGAVYNYFASKEDIVVACADKGQQNTAEMIRAAAATETGDPLSNVMTLFFSIINQPEYVKSASFDLELLAECGRNPLFAELGRRNSEAVQAQLAELVKRKQEEGVYDSSLDPVAISQVLIALFYGLMIQMLLNSDTDVDAYTSVCRAIVEGTFSTREVTK